MPHFFYLLSAPDAETPNPVQQTTLSSAYQFSAPAMWSFWHARWWRR